jgi:hypothetical protein
VFNGNVSACKRHCALFGADCPHRYNPCRW